MLEKYVSPIVVPGGLVGSADYNLTLVNKMESTNIRRDLKKENAYGMGKVSVGWHRDSGLKDFSSIAVYQTLQGATSTKTRDEWGVALRAMDGGAGGPLTSVPALMVPLPSGSLYYMLDEFNHNHEHPVIAGSYGVRYSSTHRVAREGQGTWQYIRDKIDDFFISASKYDFNKGAAIDINDGNNLSAKKLREKFVSIVRAQQLLLNEVEFEWLRQWFVQGQKVSLSFFCVITESLESDVSSAKSLESDVSCPHPRPSIFCSILPYIIIGTGLLINFAAGIKTLRNYQSVF
jgi:alpha-ketoglutarate-dependent dioxygenase FTO